MRNVAQYVLSLSGSPHDAIRARRPARPSSRACAACHGVNGKGNPALGAPDLTDKVWLHGWGEQAIVDAIQRGKDNQMPAHADKLTPSRSACWRPTCGACRNRRSRPTRHGLSLDAEGCAVSPTARRRHPDRAAARAGDEPQLVSLYEKTAKIYPRAVSGRFARWRWALVWLTQLVFYGAPWLEWNARQAVLFDLASRRFYIFGLVLYPQDFIYLTALLVLSALGAVPVHRGGRPPVVRLSPARRRCTPRSSCGSSGASRATASRACGSTPRRGGGQAVAQGGQAGRVGARIGLWTGITFVGYFTPIRELVPAIASLGLGPWEWFWVLFYGFATYGNAGFMREQVCKYMCPYARFQSAMFDRDTLIIGYDAQRGEPRGSRSRKVDPRGSWAWATASTARCACRCAPPASTSATGCSTSASAAPPASTPATA